MKVGRPSIAPGSTLNPDVFHFAEHELVNCAGGQFHTHTRARAERERESSPSKYSLALLSEYNSMRRVVLNERSNVLKFYTNFIFRKTAKTS